MMEVVGKDLYIQAVRAELPIYKPEDLAGKQYGIGAAGSDCNIQTTRVFQVLNIPVKHYPGSYTEIVNAIKDRRIAGYAKAARENALDATHLDLMTFMQLTFLTFTEQQKNTVQARYPTTPWDYVKPGQIKELPTFPGFWIPSVISSSFTTSDLPQEAGYRIAKAVFEHADEINSAFPTRVPYSTAEMTIKIFADQLTSPPLHAGFVQYFKEKKLDVPQKLIPPEYKA